MGLRLLALLFYVCFAGVFTVTMTTVDGQEAKWNSWVEYLFSGGK